MSTNTITSIRLGHGGYAKIDNVYIPATSGSMENNVSAQHQSGYLMGSGPRSRVIHADGTVTHSGTVSFDLTSGVLVKIKTLFDRGRSFSVSLCDGEGGMSMNKCYATSISLNGSPSGVLNGSLAFMSHLPASEITNDSTMFKRDEFTNGLIPYWHSGRAYVRDWSFSFNQNVIPKYHNKLAYRMQDKGIYAASPNYLFVGETDASLTFTTFKPLNETNAKSLVISVSAFTIQGKLTGVGYSMSGSNDLGMYRYSVSSYANEVNSDGSVLSIS